MAAAVAWVAANSGWISAVTSVASGLMSIQQGKEQNAALRFQGDMARLQGQERSLTYKREELNASRQANSVLERLQRANSAVVARAASMNLNPFDGSPLDLQKYNNNAAGNEWEIAQSNKEAMAIGGKNALAMGEMQKDQYYSAGKSAERSGLMKGLMSIGGGVMGYAKLGSAPTGSTTNFSMDTGAGSLGYRSGFGDIGYRSNGRFG